MRRTLQSLAAVLASTAICLAVVPQSAQAATSVGSIQYQGKQVAHFSFADQIALPKTGCARLHIRYTIDKSIVYPKSYVAFSLTSKTTTTSAMEYVEPGNGSTLPGKDPWQGTEEIVLCATGQEFVDTYGETKTAPPFRKGKYSLVAFLNVIEPVQATIATTAKPILVK